MLNALPWRDFLGKQIPISARDQWVMTRAENGVDYLIAIYDLKISRPPILIFESTEFNAFANDKNEICVSNLVLARCAQFAELTVSPAETERERLLNLKTTIMVSWVVFHELFHLGRNHIPLYKQNGDDVRKALEFDADMMAVAGLYRYLVKVGWPRDKAKKLIVHCIFWPMRHFIGSKIAAPHTFDVQYPTWHLRIMMCLVKVVQMDNGFWTDDVPVLAKQEAEQLAGDLRQWEEIYCLMHGITKSPLMQFIKEGRNGTDFVPLSKQWEAIKHLAK